MENAKTKALFLKLKMKQLRNSPIFIAFFFCTWSTSPTNCTENTSSTLRGGKSTSGCNFYCIEFKVLFLITFSDHLVLQTVCLLIANIDVWLLYWFITHRTLKEIIDIRSPTSFHLLLFTRIQIAVLLLTRDNWQGNSDTNSQTERKKNQSKTGSTVAEYMEFCILVPWKSTLLNINFHCKVLILK